MSQGSDLPDCSLFRPPVWRPLARGAKSPVLPPVTLLPTRRYTKRFGESWSLCVGLNLLSVTLVYPRRPFSYFAGCRGRQKNLIGAFPPWCAPAFPLEDLDQDPITWLQSGRNWRRIIRQLVVQYYVFVFLTVQSSILLVWFL